MLSHLIFECKNNTIVVIQRIFLMKRSFLFFLLLSLLVSNKTTAIDIPINTPPPFPIIQSTYATSTFNLTQITVTNSELAINFESSLGISTLSLTDESGRLVYQETVDVTSGLIYYLPIDLLEKGNYLLTVTGDNDSLFGTFPVEIN